MEQWMVMGVAVLVIGMIYPPLFGFVIGAGGIMLATIIVHKLIGG